MPSLSNHQSNQFTKLLIEGDSKSGKTGALACLAAAGYKLRILDMDNGLDVLKQFILRECPDKIENVEYRTLRDERKASAAGPIIDGTPKAFISAIKMLDKWKYDDIDLGDPAKWGPDAILVVDSLTFLSDAAYDFREPLAAKSRDGKYDVRAVYKDAQDAIENVLALLTSESFRTNVIIISHVKYVEVSVGSALSPTIPRYFNNVVRFTTTAGGKRQIETVSSAMFDLANAKPFDLKPRFEISTGLAEIFATLRSD